MRFSGEIIAEVLVRANAQTTATTTAGGGLYTDDLLIDWLDAAHKFGAGHRKWPFTEGRVTTTYTSSIEEWPYPEGWKSDSIRMLEIGGKQFEKVNFRDYKKFREDRATDTDKIFSDFSRTIYVNSNSGAGGSMITYGQYTPATIDATDNVALTVFSDAEEEGNEAIVEEMLKYAMMREKKMDEAAMHHNRALEILEGIWRRITGEQAGYLPKDSSMFKRIDVLTGNNEDELLKRDSFY